VGAGGGGRLPRGGRCASEGGGERQALTLWGEEDAKLAQNFGQLQHFIAVFSISLSISHRNASNNLHMLGRLNTLSLCALTTRRSSLLKDDGIVG
jgi:hypothetical protein